ncbi:MAG: bifunctional DNA-formamidopyrimidine glycosylase/DNA-(apurinic or apyrimidinic site) lyase [candidate division Zixibacteria bacterium]|nr:bifunctional DNA-formamidopyrimidine glycosylase/DNA-(apurinic or apyrimidinic site) lyase [candidate division Zixibacteria bacterium]
MGKRIDNIELRFRKILKQGNKNEFRHLYGSRIVDIKRRGKYILISLSNNAIIIIHLGMTGHLFYLPKSTLKNKHDLFVITFLKDRNELRYNDPRRFGSLRIVEGSTLNSLPLLTNLGPEPLEISSKEFIDIFKNRKQKIKTLLLDQKYIAGLGNIYIDEALFAARIHPEERATNVANKRLGTLHQAIEKILKKAINKGGSTIINYSNVFGQSGSYQFLHKVYGRENEPCLKCGDKIKRIRVSQRSSLFCPKCQKVQ